ncbi:hypothetical protein CERSUDRAFT_156525 [Gelatoporia subvermispora B]|uniref:Non-structural maintenance of chromosomes element 4 n=1 Tax=Ceriporiopsis subvermispora (strain B) TaxID=914234 RepID=M2QFG7_CERS8|nr:hypothetical protein CERSUDRAFT_156525 [Gelatoporia subvermispora B]
MPSRTSDAKAGPSNTQKEKESVYDPDQNVEERRDIRRKYRHEIEILNGNPSEISTERLTESVRRADNLFNQVKGTSEATLDSMLLVQASQAGAARARAMKAGGGAFDVDDFITRLVTFMGGRKDVNIRDDSDEEEEELDSGMLDWSRIGRRALAKSRRVPAMDFMVGPLSLEQKKRAQVKRAKLEKHKEDMRKPQEIREEDITRSENETTKNVTVIQKMLMDCGPINLFRFVINPDDFGQSVENLFYLSFLIRDGSCAFEVDEHSEPVIYSCEKPDVEDYDGGLRKQQLVMEFDMATWKRAIEVFNITSPIIPQRPKAQTRLGGKWYG